MKMKRINYFLILILALFTFHCGQEKVNFPQINVDSLVSGLSQPTLAEFIYKSGDLITHKDFPPVISQYDVWQNKKNYLLIDIRRPNDYAAGHIDGAYNVPRDSVLYFLTNKQNPAAYEKVVIICYTGQSASYTATLLRFYGVGNAYSLKYGMAGWNKQFSKSILGNLSGKYESKLDTTTYNQPAEGDLPEVAKKPAFDVLNSRVEELLKLPAKNFMVSADEVFANPQDYFIICYLPLAKYKAGHIPYAIRYNTRSDLSYGQKLKTLPTDKKIVVYCNIGQHSAAITAYLRLLGYEAYSLKFGLNSFMNNKARKNGWFSDKGFLNLPVIQGNKRTLAVASNNNQTQQTTQPQVQLPTVNIQQNESEGGGCE